MVLVAVMALMMIMVVMMSVRVITKMATTWSDQCKCCWTLAVADPLVNPSALLPMLRCSILHKDIQTTMCLYFNICCIFMSSPYFRFLFSVESKM